MTEGPSPRAGSHADPPLVPVEQHLADVLAAIRPVEPVWVPLAGAYGTVLAEAVTASTPLPSFDNSAMDGYAVRAVDLARASADTPVTLEVRGVIAAGDTGDYRVEAGACLQIMTGARLPEGADAVVPVEWTDGGTETVAIRHSPKLQHAVRHRGDDVAEGEVLLPQGTLVGPVDLALLAASGQGEVLARTPPRVAVISTGNELVEPGTPLIPGQIWESNSFMLAAAAQRAGAIVRRHRLRDDPAVVLSTLEGLLSDADLLITSGGVSMGGEHDVVKAALSKLGTITFRKVAMQPGMPQGFGTLGPDRTPIFTLPGNPVSAYVSFVLFVQPALDALKNYSPQRKPFVQAALTASVRSPRGPPVLPAGRARRRPGDRGPADRAVLPPARRAGPGQRADHRAGGRDLDGRRRGRQRNVPAMTGASTDGDRFEDGLSTADQLSLSHLDQSGHARMVDVSGKDVTARQASASGRVLLSGKAVRALRAGEVPKGDALAVARIAGIQAAKKTPDLIPLCHPIGLHAVTVELEVQDDGVAITAVTRTADRTGVEMEALTSVTVAALALIDMIKAVDPGAVITDVRVDEKTGGKTGRWSRS